MRIKKTSVNILVLIVNVAFAFLQTVVCKEKISEWKLFIMIYVPVFIICWIIVLGVGNINRRHNLLVENGRLIKAKMDPNDVSIVFALKGLLFVKIVCTFFDGNSHHVFEEQYSCEVNRYRTFKTLIDKPIEVDVISSDDYNDYHILVSSIEGGILKDDTLYCPAFLNYILLTYNVIFLLLNLLYLIIDV